MNFTQKLSKLTEDVGLKTRVAKAAGLPSSAISNYLFTEQVPRADTALALAKALNVPVQWLIDDKQEWPPPAAGSMAGNLSDPEIMYEVCRRYRHECLTVKSLVEIAEKIDWKNLGELLCRLSVDEVKAGEFRAELDAAFNLAFAPSAIERYEPDKAVDAFWRDLPGSDVPRDQIDGGNLKGRIKRLNESTPASAIQQFILATAGKPNAKLLDEQREKLRQALQGQSQTDKDRPPKSEVAVPAKGTVPPRQTRRL